MNMDFKKQIQQIFGTTDIHELQQISKDADSYRCQQSDTNNTSQKKHPTGRKNSFTEEQIAHIMALQTRGVKITDIAKQYHVSRQTIYSQIKRAHHFTDDPDVKMRMNFMNHDDLCTTIDIDFMHEKIKIKNYTDQIIFRAFGVVTEPTWNDFEYFLEDRCFPRTRDHVKDLLREMNIPFYDPLLIIEKTQGRMAEDHQWIMILKKEE